MQWWQTVFDDKYEITHGIRLTTKVELSFLQRILRGKKTVLDLACGEGRLTIPLAQIGHEVVGFDYSNYQLTRAREALKKAGDNLNIEFIQGDMRDIPFENTFDAVINMFTSFGYFDREADDLKTLKQVHKALKQDGVFILDLINKQHRVRDIEEIPEISHITESGLAVKHLNTYNNKTKRWQGKWEWGGGSYTSSVRLFSEAEMANLLRKAELQIEKIWGNYKMDDFDQKNSRRMIVQARKR